jgi:integrase
VEQRHRAWAKGRIHAILTRRGGRGLRDLALFSVAIDTMLQGPELLNLTVKDVQRSDGEIRSVIEVARPKRKTPVRCALSKVSAKALGKWIAVSGKKPADYIFFGRGTNSSRPMTARQMSRLLKSWIAEAGLDPEKYGIESLRRTKALHILNGTRRYRNSPGAFGPREDRVHSALLTYRQKIRPDRYFSSL